jgi:beta-lactamase class A
MMADSVFDGPDILFQRLAARLQARSDAFPGVLSVSVIDLTNDARIDVRSNVVLGCGSSIKILILMELMKRHFAGEIDLDQSFPIAAENRVGGAGILQYLRDDVVLTGRDLATAMIVLSDNVATNSCIDLAGLASIQRTLAELTPNSQLLIKMQDYASAAKGIENVATAADMAEWIRVLVAGTFVSPAVSQACLQVLSLRKSGLLNDALPSDLVIANKPGGLNGGKSDAGWVGLARRPYIVSVMTAFCYQGNGQETVIETFREIHETMAALAKYKPMGVPHADYFVKQGRANPQVLNER